MIKIDGSLFIQIINFLFLIWVLNTILYRPIRAMLLKRKETVTGMEEDIQSLSRYAKEKDNAFISGIKSARSDGSREKEKLIQIAQAEEKKMIADINQKYQADLVVIREKISKEAQEVRAVLMQEVDKFANEIGQKILGRAV